MAKLIRSGLLALLLTALPLSLATSAQTGTGAGQADRTYSGERDRDDRDWGWLGLLGLLGLTGLLRKRETHDHDHVTNSGSRAAAR